MVSGAQQPDSDTITPAQNPGLLVIRLEDTLTPEMASLRSTSWDTGGSTSTDEFDPESRHLVIRREGKPVAMVRLTIGARSVLQHWSRGACQLPHGPTVAELTRSVVASDVRRRGLYRLTMIETVLRLSGLGVTQATAAIAHEFPAKSFLIELGFQNVGAPVRFDDLPRYGTLAQCIRLDLRTEHESGWGAMWREQVDRLAEHGFRVDSDAAAVIGGVTAPA